MNKTCSIPWPKARQIIHADAIDSAIAEQAAVINQQLADQSLLVISVLTGGLVYTGKLLPHLTLSMQLETIRVTRYRNQTTGGAELDWLAKPSMSLKGEKVLFLDDIFDEGKTLLALDEWARAEGASHVYSAVMVNKQHARKPELYQPDFIGLTVPDHYVFGMGMDYRGAWRNANGIWVLDE